MTLTWRRIVDLRDAACRRCTDAISSAMRLATSSGRPDSAQPTISKLNEALEAIELARAQFKVRSRGHQETDSGRERKDNESV